MNLFRPFIHTDQASIQDVRPQLCHSLSSAAQARGGGGVASQLHTKQPVSPCLHLKAATICSQEPRTHSFSLCLLSGRARDSFQILVNFHQPIAPLTSGTCIEHQASNFLPEPRWLHETCALLLKKRDVLWCKTMRF